MAIDFKVNSLVLTPSSLPGVPPGRSRHKSSNSTCAVPWVANPWRRSAPRRLEMGEITWIETKDIWEYGKLATLKSNSTSFHHIYSMELDFCNEHGAFVNIPYFQTHPHPKDATRILMKQIAGVQLQPHLDEFWEVLTHTHVDPDTWNSDFVSVGRRTSYWKKAKEYATWASLLLASPVWACRCISQCSIFKMIKMACWMPFFGDGDSSPLLWSNILQSSTNHPQFLPPCWIPRLEAHWLSPAALRSCGERDGRKERRSRGVPLHHLSVRGVVQRVQRVLSDPNGRWR